MTIAVAHQPESFAAMLATFQATSTAVKRATSDAELDQAAEAQVDALDAIMRCPAPDLAAATAKVRALLMPDGDPDAEPWPRQAEWAPLVMADLERLSARARA